VHAHIHRHVHARAHAHTHIHKQGQLHEFYKEYCPERQESAQEVARMYASDVTSLNKVRSVLQSVAVCCSLLQCVVECKRVLSREGERQERCEGGAREKEREAREREARERRERARKREARETGAREWQERGKREAKECSRRSPHVRL